MKNKKPNHKTINAGSEQVFVGTSQLNKLDIEELNKVSGARLRDVYLDEPVAY